MYEYKSGKIRMRFLAMPLDKSFTGIAFVVIISMALADSVWGRQCWWFGMLFPAFAFYRSGISQIVQIKANGKTEFEFAGQDAKFLNQSKREPILPPASNRIYFARYQIRNMKPAILFRRALLKIRHGISKWIRKEKR